MDKAAYYPDWEGFLAEATDIFVAKNTDYDSRFMRALIQYRAQRGYEAARTIWAWEVEKKLDRCRTWIKRGELQVKDEGVRNSVIDAFNYTVQFSLFVNSLRQRGVNPVESLTEANFYALAAKFKPQDWINYWESEGLLDFEVSTDKQVALLLAREMTGRNG
jgi:hypothetical protein